MSIFVPLIRRISNSPSVPSTENCELADMKLPVSRKRLHDENFQKSVVRKKRKLNPVNLNGFEDTLAVADSVKKPYQRPVRSCRMKNNKPCGDTDSLNPLNARVKRLNIKSCNNSDIDNINKKLANCRTKSRRNNGVNLPETTNSVTRQGALTANKSQPANGCRRSLPLKDRVTQKPVEEVCAQKIEKRRGRPLSTNQRESLPLSTSTAYNTKQNNEVSPKTNRRYNLRRYALLSIKSSIVEKTIPEKKTVADKTVIDHSKRFSKSNSTTAVKKCDIKNRVVKSHVQHEKKKLQEKQKITNKLLDKLVEIPEKRSASKKHVDKEKPTKREAPKKKIMDKLFVKMPKKKLVSKKRVDEGKSMKKIAHVKKITDKLLDAISEKELVLKKHAAEEKLTKNLVPMTEKMNREIKKILSSGKTPLIQIRDAAIELRDIHTLRDLSWLGDKIINAYMNLIKIRSEKDQENYPKVHCFNSFFYWQLCGRGYKSVQRWTKNIDVFDYAVIIIPIHLNNHWCLIEIRMKDKVIRYYDSLGKPNNRCLETILQYLTSEHEEKRGEQLNLSRWKSINVPRNKIPIQKNAHDCGVFACTYAEHIARNASFNFNQADMRYFRRKIICDKSTTNLMEKFLIVTTKNFVQREIWLLTGPFGEVRGEEKIRNLCNLGTSDFVINSAMGQNQPNLLDWSLYFLKNFRFYENITKWLEFVSQKVNRFSKRIKGVIPRGRKILQHLIVMIPQKFQNFLCSIIFLFFSRVVY